MKRTDHYPLQSAGHISTVHQHEQEDGTSAAGGSGLKQTKTSSTIKDTVRIIKSLTAGLGYFERD